jgi:predicted NBD/HSP70 family sugar kinase
MCDQQPLIGVGIPGSLNPETQLVRNSNTICLNQKPLKDDLENLLQIPVMVENDANCFALSEALLGAGQGASVVVGLIMGTGMGGGIIKDGKIWRGRNGIAGEFGHTTLDINGRDCWCGAKGCLERYISGTAIELRYFEATGTRLDLKSVYDRYLQGTDVAANKVIEELLFYFSRSIANIISSLDPDLIVIGGGVSNLPVLYTKGAKLAAKQVFGDRCTTPIIKNKLGDSSGIFGAALLAGR